MEIYTGGNIEKLKQAVETIYRERKVDVVIGSRIVTSKWLKDLGQYPIPTIASIQLTDELLEAEASANRTSDINNFTYINSPFNIIDGIEKLTQICHCQEIAVLTPPAFLEMGLNARYLEPGNSIQLNWIELDADLINSVSRIPDEVGAVYLLSPMADYKMEDLQLFFKKLQQQNLPSFTLLDAPLLQLGAYAAYASSENLMKIPRRIALNVERIMEGQNAKDLPVNMETFSQQLHINMEAVKKTNLYPDWNLLDEAILIYINRPYTTRVINLKSAIAEGMENNLGYQIAEKEAEISSKGIGLARSNYLPQLNVESTGYFLDSNSVNNSFGTQGEFNWTAGASFSQLILSEPAMANIAIQKLLYESDLKAKDQSELDVILETAQRFFNILQIKAVADLQNDNIQAINQNLTIATDKQKVGYSGLSDVHRWKTELNLAKTDLNATNAQLQAASYALNESLNRPIGESFAISDDESINSLIEELDDIFSELIPNEAVLNLFADFMVREAFENLPEVKQIDLAIAAQERLLKSNKRAFYIPTIGVGAQYNYPIETVNPGEPPPIPGFETEINPNWNVGVNVSYPIFNGLARKQQKEQTKIGLLQLQDNKKEVNNLLELQVRANVQTVSASFNNIRLTENAATEANKNVAIVRDFYKSGQVDIITLVDAQNTLLGAQINAANAKYQFMIDYFALQRSVGYYLFLDTEDNKQAFLQRFVNFK
ncbi:MAG TPA: TolC family protein [Saprospiraceae bacterium]|nr:TolC family protein [Saprospiraceae bacterium]HMQ84624.1 TolC family protein [Saprospiraceae bacterium]